MRQRALGAIRGESMWDLIIIGGGATGLGTAVDASARGYRTLLLEGGDFAAGTSSRCTKLIHGGVRYLAQARIGLVREALRERSILRRNAPHIVHERAFLVPSYSWFGRAYYGLGLKCYDLLAGRHGLTPSRGASRVEALKLAPTLHADGLRGGTLYSDGQFDDARLAIALLRTFLDLGGIAVNYAPVVGLIEKNGQVRGVVARDTETGEELRTISRVVVNATGVFADDIRHMDDENASTLIRPSQGAHLVLDHRFLPGETAVMVPRTDDGRVLFAIPWHERVLIGTTDTPVSKVSNEPRPLSEEIAFLLDHAGRYLTPPPRAEDVLCTFAALRPLFRGSAKRGTGTSLGADSAWETSVGSEPVPHSALPLRPTGHGATAKVSREHAVVVSESGLVTVTGGKWTTYRVMADDAVTRAATLGELPRRECPTRELRLHGATDTREPRPFAIYGSDVPEVTRLIAERPEWGELLHPALPYRVGEVIWSARHEMARTVADVLARRTRALYLDARASREIAPRVAALLAEELGFDAAWQARQVSEFGELAERHLIPSTR